MKKRLLAMTLSLFVILSVFSGIQIVAGAKTLSSVQNTGKTYYVDAESGNDKYSGLSEEKAWKTLDNVNNTTFEPGSAILLRRGCSWENTLLWPKGTGDEQNQNYISCYGDESEPLPYVSSLYSDKISGLPNADACLYLGVGQNYWTVEKLTLNNGTDGTGTQTVVKLTSNSPRMAGVVLRDCVIQGSNPDNWKVVSKSGLGGINVEGYVDNVLIENNEIYNVKATGISVNGWVSGVNYKGEKNEKAAKGVVIRNNYLENIGKDGIITNNCFEPLVEYNVVNKAHSYATNSAHVALWPFACYGALFQYNEAYNTQTTGDGQGFDCDYICYNTTFQYNYSHDNTGGFMLICTEASASWLNPTYAYNVGSTVRYNISQNDHHYAFSLIDGIQQTRIYNNIIYGGRNVYNATHLFWSYDKGANKLTGLHYADDIYIANNIFYLDSFAAVDIGKCTNVVWKNNCIGGSARFNGPKNGVSTYLTETGGNPTADADGNPVYQIKESSGNLYNTNPMFADPGNAQIGRDTCDGYKLFEGSDCIGAGIAIDDGYHACPNDYYGNPIDKNSVNIGAYQGSGVDRPKHTYDGKYETMIDFEHDTVGEVGKGTSGVALSGIERCSEATGNAYITDEKAALNQNTSSKKALALNNTDLNTTKTVKAGFYVYGSELQKANGYRIWLDPNGRETTFTVTMKISNSLSYIKTFTMDKAGWRVFTFNEKYSGSNNKRVDAAVMRTMLTVSIAASVAAGRSVFVDDIQTNVGIMDDEDSPLTSALEPATTTLVEDFETAEILASPSRNNIYGGSGVGPTGDLGIKMINESKAFYASSSSSASTAVGHYMKWAPAFEKLRTALTADPDAEGLQMYMPTFATDANGVPINDEEKYSVSDRWGRYTIAIKSSNPVSYTTNGGVAATANGFKMMVVPDKNNDVRVQFDQTYFTYKEDNVTYTVKFSDFDKTAQQSFLQGVNGFDFSYTTFGGILKKTLYITFGVDNISLYKNVAHEPSDWKVFKDATCTEDGEKRITCKRCGDVLDSQIIKAIGHTEQWVVTKEVTCTEDGEKSLTCTRCGEISETQTLTHSGHDLEIITVAPTCLNDGFTVEKCKKCDYEGEKTDITAATGHLHTEWVVDAPSSCTKDGSCHLECIDCHEILENGVTTAEHKFVKTVKAPTCTTDGFTHYECSACGKKFDTDITKATGHHFGGFVTDKISTYFAEGQRSRHCSGCGLKTGVSVIPRLTLSAPRISVKAQKKQAKISWKRVNGADGYIVYKKVGSKAVKLKSVKALSFTAKKLKSKSKISFVVKAYVTGGKNTVYSINSNVKTVKIK